MAAEMGGVPPRVLSGMAVVTKYLTGLDVSNDHDDPYFISPGSQRFPEGGSRGDKFYEYRTVITLPKPSPPRVGARVGAGVGVGVGVRVGAGVGVGFGVAVGARTGDGVAVGTAPLQSATNDRGRSISTASGLEKRSTILGTSPDQPTNPWRHLACTRTTVPLV